MNAYLPLTLLIAGVLGTGGKALAAQENTATQIATQLAQHSKVRGHFLQTRTLEGMANVLHSEGEYFFWRDHGIYWATLQPVEQAITYRSDKTLRWLPGETLPEEIRSSKDKHFRRILMAIFSFDKEQLARQFHQDWEIEGAEWQLRLTPNNRASKRFLENILLWGGADIEGLRIANSNGEHLTIEFTDREQLDALDPQVCVSHFGYTPEQCNNFLPDAAP